MRLAHLSAAPTLKRPDQEEEADGSVLVTVLKETPLGFKTRACNNRLGVRNGRRTGARRTDSGANTSDAGGYERQAHDGEDYSDAE